MRHIRPITWPRAVRSCAKAWRLGRCASSLADGNDGRSRVTCGATTGRRDAADGGNAYADDATVRRVIEQTVPTTYTSVAQIARALPSHILETLSLNTSTHADAETGPNGHPSPPLPTRPWQGAGLTGFLAYHSTLFELSHIGSIAVVRRRHAVPSASPSTASSLRVVAAHTPPNTRSHSTRKDDNDRHAGRGCHRQAWDDPLSCDGATRGARGASAALTHTSSFTRQPPPYFAASWAAAHPPVGRHRDAAGQRGDEMHIPHVVLGRYPSYLIPLHALWTSVHDSDDTSERCECAQEPHQRRDAVLRALRYHVPYLTRQGGSLWCDGEQSVLHDEMHHDLHTSFSRVTRTTHGGEASAAAHATGTAAETASHSDTAAHTHVALEAMYGYVSLSSAVVAAARRCGALASADEADEVHSRRHRSRGRQRGVTPDERYAQYRVAEYEWYRVARLIPQLGVDVPITNAFALQAAALLPPGRSVLHVLYSAPHLFQLTAPAAAGDSPGQRDECAARRKSREGERSAAVTTMTESLPYALTNAHTRAVAAGTHKDESTAARACELCTGEESSDAWAPASHYRVRFLLHPYYIPPHHRTCDELQAELDALDAHTTTTSASTWETGTEKEDDQQQRGIRNRRKRRALTRQLEYLIRPSPFFDERVLAQCLFDALPMHDGVPFNQLIGTALPASARACMPRDGSALLRRYPHLFTVVTPHDGLAMVNKDVDEHGRESEGASAAVSSTAADASTPFSSSTFASAAAAAAARSHASVTLVYRSDVAVAVPRSVRSIDAEEILLELFNRFPARQHPAQGTCIFRCLAKLPAVMQQRLHQTCSVEEEILRPYPEKVEIIACSPHRAISFHHHHHHHDDAHETKEQSRPSDAHAMSAKVSRARSMSQGDDGASRAVAVMPYTEEQLRCCRGRRDFFITFRFVGTWQKQLLRHYEKMCAKTGRDPTV